MPKTKSPKQLSWRQFSELLEAAFNISDSTEAADDCGDQLTVAALNASKMMFGFMELGPCHRDGVLLAAKLLTECSLAKDPQAYAIKECKRAWAGRRHEFDGATIKLGKLPKK